MRATGKPMPHSTPGTTDQCPGSKRKAKAEVKVKAYRDTSADTWATPDAEPGRRRRRPRWELNGEFPPNYDDIPDSGISVDTRSGGLPGFGGRRRG